MQFSKLSGNSRAQLGCRAPVLGSPLLEFPFLLGLGELVDPGYPSKSDEVDLP